MKLEIRNVDDLMMCSQVSKFWEILKFSIEIDLFNLVGKAGIKLDILVDRLGCDSKRLLYAIRILALAELINIDSDYITNSNLTNQYLTNQYNNKISDLLLYNAKTTFSAQEYRRILMLNDMPVKKTDDDLYMSAMNIGSKYVAVKVASKLLIGRNKKLLDIGCGSGVFSIMACKYNKSLQAVCVDRKNMLAMLENKLKALPIINDRITLVESEILSLDFDEQKFNYILLSNILHFFSPDEIIKLLSSCYKWLTKTGKIIINDIFISKNNMMRLMFSLEWLSNGNDFIEINEMKDILKKLGFLSIDLLCDKRLPTDVIIAEKAR